MILLIIHVNVLFCRAKYRDDFLNTCIEKLYTFVSWLGIIVVGYLKFPNLPVFLVQYLKKGCIPWKGRCIKYLRDFLGVDDQKLGICDEIQTLVTPLLS